MASEFPKDTIGQPPSSSGMIDRIKNLLLTPKEEWPRIDAQPMTVQGILTGWVAPLAAIGPIASLIQQQVFPLNVFGMVYRPPLIGSIVTAVLMWLLVIGMVYVWSLIIDALAPSFGGTKNPISALKVAAFSATAGWICGIFGILPFLGILAILGALYNIYLLWVGGPLLMKVPQDKAVVFVIVSIIVGIVANLVAGLIAMSIAGAMFAMTPGAGPLTTPGGGSVTVGGTTFDTGKIEAATAKMQAASEQMQASVNGKPGGVKAVDPAALQGMLPASIAGYSRTTIESSGGGAAGINGSTARGEYRAGDKNISMSITDMGALGNLATLGGALNVQSSKQTATGYEKTQMVDGRMVSEEWNTDSKSGKFGVMVGSRFMVEASGSAPDVDTLKNAVAGVNFGQLEALAK
jgi:hypothetical protein